MFCKHVHVCKKKIHCFCSINTNKRMQSKKVSDKLLLFFCETENFISTSGLFSFPFFHKCTSNYSLKSFCGFIPLEYRSVPLLTCWHWRILICSSKDKYIIMHVPGLGGQMFCFPGTAALGQMLLWWLILSSY